MTVGAWVIWGIMVVIVVLITIGVGIGTEEVSAVIISGLLGVMLCGSLLLGMLWWFNSTADGSRALKTQESNFNNGINRKVTVYDMEGDVIQVYEGKFDVEYDNNRILFDDENGLRHIIYYPTGTVTIDEIKE